MTNKTSIPRIRSVKFKNGGEVRVLKHESSSDRGIIERRVRGVLDAFEEVPVGFAFIVWGEDGISCCAAGRNEKSQIPHILIPDFIRNRILADQIEDWALDEVKVWLKR